MASKLYKALVWPILEYSNPGWGPTFILDQRKIENVQRRAIDLFHLLEATSIQRDWQC